METLDKKSTRYITTASSIGNLIDWYSFSVYGSLSVVLAHVFFPTSSPIVALLDTFLVFGVGYLFRPLGALVFGYYGDRIGRKPTLIVTLVGSGVATGMIGLLPTTAMIGIGAAFLLTALRIFQGFFVGGEYGGAATYIGEDVPPNRIGFHTSFLQSTFAGGIILSIAVILPLTLIYGNSGLVAFAWRIPFLLSFMLLLVGVIMRLKLSESKAFKSSQTSGKISRNPIFEVFRKYPKEVFLLGLVGMAAGSAVYGYVGALYVLVYVQTVLKVGYALSYEIFLPAIISVVFFMILFGWLSDKIGRKRVFILGQFIGAAVVIPLFLGLGFANSFSSYPLLVLFAILVEVPYGMMQGTLAAFLLTLFPTKVRYSGFSFPYQMGLGIFGGFQPYIATYLLATLGGVIYASNGSIVSYTRPWIGLIYTVAGTVIGGIVLLIFSKEKDLKKAGSIDAAIFDPGKAS